MILWDVVVNNSEGDSNARAAQSWFITLIRAEQLAGSLSSNKIVSRLHLPANTSQTYLRSLL